MTMFRTLRTGLLIGLSGVALGSCISPPDYPETPSIEFSSLQVKRQPSTPGDIPKDSIIVTVSYKDGDGDLGLSQEEYSGPPYQRLNNDGTLNLNHWNYFFKLFVKNPQSNIFEPYTLTPDLLEIKPEAYYGQFPHLEPDPDKAAPLRGELRFGQLFTLGSPFYPGQEVRFEITIKDRALNTSNTVTTSSFVVTR